MKKYIKIIILALIFSACSEELVIDEVFDGTQSGAVLRTVEVSSALNFFDLANSEFSVTLEEQDAANGGLLERVDVFLAFVDNTPENGVTTVAEKFVEAIPAASFVNNDRNLPQASYSISANEMIQVMGLNSTQFTGGDQFIVRFALVLTDGRVFSSDNVAGIVSGSAYFKAPFRYFSTMICPSDMAGVHNFSTVPWCGGPAITGEVEFIMDTEGVYSVDIEGNNDMSFGAYDACYGDGTNIGSAGFYPEGTVQIQDACGKLTYIGSSQWGEIYQFNSVTVNGSDLTIDWENDYGEAGVTTLTRTDGEDWGPLTKG